MFYAFQRMLCLQAFRVCFEIIGEHVQNVQVHILNLFITFAPHHKGRLGKGFDLSAFKARERDDVRVLLRRKLACAHQIGRIARGGYGNQHVAVVHQVAQLEAENI